MPNKKISDFATVTSIQNNDKFLMNSAGTTSTVTLNTLRDTVTNNSIKLPSPASNGQILTYNGTTWIAATAPSTGGIGEIGPDVGTYQISALPGVGMDYAAFGIPEISNKFHFVFDEISVANWDVGSVRLQFGDSLKPAGQEWFTTDYEGTRTGLVNGSNPATSYISDGFALGSNDANASLRYSGIASFTRVGDIWYYRGVFGSSAGQARVGICAGYLYTGRADRIRITTSTYDESDPANGGLLDNGIYNYYDEVPVI